MDSQVIPSRRARKVPLKLAHGLVDILLMIIDDVDSSLSQRRWTRGSQVRNSSVPAELFRRWQSFIVKATRRVGGTPTSSRRIGADAGFTLIELMVVLLILAILLAIAIPTFLGVTNSANDRAAQSNLNTALVNAKSIFQQSSQSYLVTGAVVTSYSSSFAASLYGAQPNISFVTDTVTGGSNPAAVSVSVVDANGLALAEHSKATNNCWFTFDNAATESWTTGGTGSVPNKPGAWYGESKGASSCTAGAIPAPNGTTIVYSQNGFPNL
jgi:type IV pilus assembly protein PilA